MTLDSLDSFGGSVDGAVRAHRRTVAVLAGGVDELRTGIGLLPGVLDGVAPGAVRDAAARCVARLVEIGSALLGEVEEVLRGIGAPFRFLDLARRWQEVRGTATGVVGALDPALLPAAGTWHGEAAEAYARASTPQVAAATRIGVIAERITSVLLQCALDGIAFYLTVELILAKLLAAFGAALVAAGSVVLSPVAFGLCVEEAAVSPALLAGAVTALVTSLAVQSAQLVTLHGEALDRSAFPGGRWPDAATGRYTDATVTDGDADWSLAH